MPVWLGSTSSRQARPHFGSASLQVDASAFCRLAVMLMVTVGTIVDPTIAK